MFLKKILRWVLSVIFIFFLTFTLTLFKLILHVKNEAPMVGPISLDIFEIYFATKLVFPTPETKHEKENFMGKSLTLSIYFNRTIIIPTQHQPEEFLGCNSIF